MVARGSLEPTGVFDRFLDLCDMPHGSGDTSAVTNYLINFAKEHNLEYEADEVGNVIIKKDGTGSAVNHEPVLLQGHTDMVCVKTDDSDHDFTKDPLDVNIDGDYLFAKNTSLGGDDGVAVAYMLDILQRSDLTHPPIEALFTIDEETGMDGAKNLKKSWINAKRMINLDSEEEGVFTTGCAGGVDVISTFDIERENADGTAFAIRVSGLKGGHSGAEIEKPVASAIRFMARAIKALSSVFDIKLVSITGGEKRNAIPVFCDAVILADESAKEQIKSYLAGLNETFENEYRGSEDGISVTVSDCENSLLPMKKECADKIIAFLLTVPQGVEKMNAFITTAVETSTNLGIVETQDTTFTAYSLTRSSVKTSRDALADRICVLTKALGGSCVCEGDYPAWEPKADSELTEYMRKAYVNKFGKDPVVSVTHGGLECGLISELIPEMQIVSIGPDMIGIHTTGEKLSISSTKRTYDYLLDVLSGL